MYTFIIQSEYFYDIIKKMLVNRGNWKEASKDEEKVDYIHVDGKYAYSRNLTLLPKSNLINILNEQKNYEISTKGYLFDNMRRTFPKIYKKYFPQQYTIDLNKKFPLNKKLLIKLDKNLLYVKPIYDYGGSGIRYFTNIQNLQTYLKSIQDKYLCHKKKFNKSCHYVISKDINNPLLYQDKKFHIRMYFLCTNINNKNKFYIFKNGEIFTAKSKYNPNIISKDVLDSHGHSTTGNPVYPDSLKLKPVQLDHIHNQILHLFSYIKNIIKPRCNSKDQNCYELFGIDIMITKDLNVKIIEINSKLEFLIPQNKIKDFIETQLSLSVDKLYPNPNPSKYHKFFDEI